MVEFLGAASMSALGAVSKTQKFENRPELIFLRLGKSEHAHVMDAREVQARPLSYHRGPW
jgi:hypothetical protein